MKSIKEKIKSKVKAKAQALKDKLKGAKAKRCSAIVAAVGVAVALSGCATADPASRSNNNKIGDVEPAVKLVLENAHSNTVSVVLNVTFGDGLIASADSKGSTETQTATPTTSIPIRIDARYNDAISAATPASKKVLGSIGDGLGAVLDMMASKKSGKVDVVKTDGTPAVVTCDNGQCSFSSGCSDCTDSSSCSSCTDNK